MSDRTWNRIEVSIFEEEWSNAAILIATALKGNCRNRYGIFRTPMKFLNSLFGEILGTDKILEALNELERECFIERHINGDNKEILWIRNHFCNDPKQVAKKYGNLIGLYRELVKYPRSLVLNFIKEYPDYFDEEIILHDELEDKDREKLHDALHDVIHHVKNNKKEKLHDVIRDVTHDVLHDSVSVS